MVTVVECTERINDLASFDGSEAEAQVLVDTILLNMSELENEIALDAMKATADTGLASSHRSIQLDILRSNLELAQESAKAARQSQWEARRKEFFCRPSDTKTGTKSAHDADTPALTMAEQVLANLRRIHDRAEAEVLRGEMNLDDLQASTKALQQVENQFSAVGLLLNGSRRLVQILNEADARDRRQMQFALGFLATVLMWIVYRRVLKLPLKILFWALARVLGIAKWVVPKSVPHELVQEEMLETVETITGTMVQTVVETLIGTVEGTASSTVPLVTDTLFETLVETAQPIHGEL